MAQDKELGRFKRTVKEGDTEELVVTTGQFGKSPKHVDFRAYYETIGGEMRPTKQGVRTDITNVPKIISLLANSTGNEEFKEELNKLLTKHKMI